MHAVDRSAAAPITAAILRGRFNDEPAQITYLQRWIEVAKGKAPNPTIDVSRPPEGTTLFPTAAQLTEFEKAGSQLTEPCLSIDTEEAGIYLICIGFTWLDLATGEVGKTLNLPIRLRGGRQAHEPSYLEKVVIPWLDRMFSDESIAKVFHNGVTHDVPILMELGFDIRGPLFDTMVLLHLAYPEFKKSLQYGATLWLGAPVWKTLVDEEDELEGK